MFYTATICHAPVPHNRLHLLKRPPPVRYRVLLVGGKLGEGLVVSVWNEKRIVAKALDPCLLFGDVSRAMSVDDKFLARRINKRAAASEARGAILDAFEVLKEKRVVRRSVRRLARIARAMDTRRAAERLDLETGVIGHAPLALVLFGNRSHLDKRIARKVRRIFFDALRIVGNNLEARENLRYLAYLVLVMRRNKKLHLVTSLRTLRLSALASLGLARYKSRAPLARRLRASAF